MALKNVRVNKTFASILADGLFHQTVPEGTEGAVKRYYETSDGKKGTKTELTFDTMSGVISAIFFFEGEFGSTLHVVVDGVELSMNTASTYAEDFMKKLPNIDLSKEVELSPYAFTDEKGKARKGISIVQDGVKIQNAFYDFINKKACGGIEKIKLPKEDKRGKISKDAWKLYFGQVRAFLVENTEENFCTEEKVSADADDVDGVEVEDDEVDGKKW